MAAAAVVPKGLFSRAVFEAADSRSWHHQAMSINHRDSSLFVIRVGASDLCQDRVKPRSQDFVRLLNA